jgi:sporulation-control protein
MVFKRMLKALGVGGPSVDTVIADPRVRPGELVTGEVRMAGGEVDADIEHIALSLVTRVERGERGAGNVEFHRSMVSGPFRLAAKEERGIPFSFSLPWETPLNTISGRQLPGLSLGLRTELAVAKAVDPGDTDPLYVEPLPSQDRVLDAFGELGFHFRKADLEAGRIYGVPQQLPFFQEIEFYPPSRYAGRVNEVELTFVAAPGGLEVVLEADKRAGLFQPGGDAFGRFGMSHQEAEHADWAAIIDEWLNQLASRRSMHHDSYGHHHDGHGGGGMGGVGGMVAGAAAGVVGGMVLGEVFDGMFGGDEEE